MRRYATCASFSGSLNAWEKLMELAAVVLHQDSVQAEIHYQQALVLAEEMLGACVAAGDDEVAEYGDAVIAAFVVAHHNLADIYRGQDRRSLAAQHYQEALQRLESLCKDEAAPEDLRALATRHMTRVLGEWVAYQQQCGNYPASRGQRAERPS